MRVREVETSGVGQDLDCDGAIELCIASAVHFARAAGPQGGPIVCGPARVPNRRDTWDPGLHPRHAEGLMGILTDDMKRVVREQRLGFHATVSGDGTPNLSPKGTTAVWDDDHLFFAHIRSSQTVANIRRGSQVEINVVDPFARKGYRFKGPALVHEPGSATFDIGMSRLHREGFTTPAERVKAIVVIEVRHAQEITSPAYDDGTRTEADIRRAWRDHFARVYPPEPR